MALIKINNLQPAGTDLFNDSESFMNELNSQELELVNGGKSIICTTVVITITITMF